MNRPVFGLMCVLAAVVVLASGCGPVGHGAGAEGNPGDWAIYVPPGWHVVRFSDLGNARSEGIQLSNVPLPSPVQPPRAPAQVDGRAFPASGVGVVISTSARPGPAGVTVAPPLPLPWPDGTHGGPERWSLGGSLAGSPVSEWLWFRNAGKIYVAAIFIGSEATRIARRTLGPIIGSIKPEAA